MYTSKKIGVWGFGIVGKSVANYLHTTLQLRLRSVQGERGGIQVLEKRELTEQEKQWLEERNITFLNQSTCLENFLESSDIIIPSPGINLSDPVRPELVEGYKNKFLCELDLFAANFKKPIIAITGTLGKTSTTHLLTKLLCSAGVKAVAAGNIGLGMCDLLLKQDEIDLVVLEVSSFQLEQTKLLKPAIAIWTNFYPNHLDRHPDIKSYFDAKRMIMSKQDIYDNAIVPFSLLPEIYKDKPACKINFFTTKKVTLEDLALLKEGDSLFFVENEEVYVVHGSILFADAKNSPRTDQGVFPLPVRPERVEGYGQKLNTFPEITFLENWLIICITFNLLKLNLNIDIAKLDIPEHRLEKFAQIDSVEFYNDSKSTVSESTLAAVSKFKPNEVILFLGGLSKGVDRSILVKELKNKVRTIICFGKEAEQLKSFCDANLIEAYQAVNLNEAVDLCVKVAHSNDKILFSPAGSSYDLFANYQERGRVFKELIKSKYKTL